MRGRSAQAMVEFALTITLFMLLIMGTFDLARAYVAYVVVANATREAARYGSAHVTDVTWVSDATSAGKNVAFGIDSSRLSLVPTTLPYLGLTVVQVAGSYGFYSVTPFVGALMGNPITITASTYTLVG